MVINGGRVSLGIICLLCGCRAGVDHRLVYQSFLKTGKMSTVQQVTCWDVIKYAIFWLANAVSCYGNFEQNKMFVCGRLKIETDDF